MPLEPQEVRGKSSEEGFGSLRGCLVEGDAEQRIRERRVRRRALTISIVLQSAVLATLILVPLFSKTPRIALANYVPVPPYHHPGGPTRPDHQPPTPPRSNLDTHCIYCPPTRIPAQIFTEDPGVSSNQDPFGSGKPLGPGDDTPCLGCIDIVSQNRGPIPPPPPSTTQTNPRVIRMTQLDPALLIHRVEPVYPPLAKQTHREGRVELRAIIGTDGRIRSLQIVAGDPLFEQSAVEAVQQWRYKPTILNGQPIEIDTSIMVIYSMQH